MLIKLLNQWTHCGWINLHPRILVLQLANLNEFYTVGFPRLYSREILLLELVSVLLLVFPPGKIWDVRWDWNCNALSDWFSLLGPLKLLYRPFRAIFHCQYYFKLSASQYKRVPGWNSIKNTIRDGGSTASIYGFSKLIYYTIRIWIILEFMSFFNLGHFLI